MTDINKLIEEEARKYASVAHEITDVEKLRDFPGAKNVYNKYKAFEAGANFILSKWQHENRWRKVEEELPEVGILVHVKIEHIPSGKTLYSHASFQKDYKDGFWSIDSAFGGKYKVTEWKRIEE